MKKFQRHLESNPRNSVLQCSGSTKCATELPHWFEIESLNTHKSIQYRDKYSLKNPETRIITHKVQSYIFRTKKLCDLHHTFTLRKFTIFFVLPQYINIRYNSRHSICSLYHITRNPDRPAYLRASFCHQSTKYGKSCGNILVLSVLHVTQHNLQQGPLSTSSQRNSILINQTIQRLWIKSHFTIHSAVWFNDRSVASSKTSSPRVLYRASSFSFQHPLTSIRPSSSWLRLLLRLPVVPILSVFSSFLKVIH